MNPSTSPLSTITILTYDTFITYLDYCFPTGPPASTLVYHSLFYTQQWRQFMLVISLLKSSTHFQQYSSIPARSCGICSLAALFLLPGFRHLFTRHLHHGLPAVPHTLQPFFPFSALCLQFLQPGTSALDISQFFPFTFFKVSGHVPFLKENFLDHQSKTAITLCSLSAFLFFFMFCIL